MNEAEAIEIIWRFLQRTEQPTDYDVIICPGSRDDDSALIAADMQLSKPETILVFTGGNVKANTRLQREWPESTEAEHFAQIAGEKGVERSKIILETQAQNSGDNIIQSHKLLHDAGVKYSTILFVTKPSMEKRILATALAQWADTSTSFETISRRNSFSEHSKILGKDRRVSLIATALGDYKRLIDYAENGFMSYTPISDESVEAFNRLVDLGFVVR